MTELVSFGDPARFEIAVRWMEDREPRERRPAHGGWSTGEFRLTVGNYILTRHERSTGSCDTVQWYLLPVFEWIAKNWTYLLHEERFAWRETDVIPAATAVFHKLRRLIDSDEVSDELAYAKVQNWWSRHAIWAADSSALYPDVVIRRLIDNIEISWTGRQPTHAPDGFQFALAPGTAMLSIPDVAGPLWEALAWAVSCQLSIDEQDRKSIVELEQMIANLATLPTAVFERTYLAPELFRKVEQARGKLGVQDDCIRVTAVPAIANMDASVLMFGGVTPDLEAGDINDLVELLTFQRNGSDSANVSKLVNTDVGLPMEALSKKAMILRKS